MEEGEESNPFSKKMDQALQFIDEALLTNLQQFENFGKITDESELEINQDWVEERKKRKEA